MSSRSGRSLRGGSLLLCVLLAACQSTAPPPVEPAGLPQLTMANADEKALLLLLADRRMYEGFVVNKGLEGDAELHQALAVALGRADQPDGRVVLERLLADDDIDVRRAAAFALGELEQELSKGVLLATAADRDRETGRLAVEALAKLDVGLTEVRRAVDALDATEQWERLLPYLFRFDKQESLPLAVSGLEVTTGTTRAFAAYALARRGVEAAAPHLRGLLADPDPWIRGWAARTLGDVGDRSDMPRIQTLLTDGEEGPTVQALRAGRRLVERAVVAPPPEWREEILLRIDDPRPGVRLTAIEVAGAWLPDAALGDELARRAESGSRREQQLALLALARGGDPRAADLTRRAAASEDVQLRRHAAQAAGLLADSAVLEDLASDDHPAVRVAVLEERFAALEREDGGESVEPTPSAPETASAALEDLSAAVRSSALRWLSDNPELPVGRMRGALAPSSGGDRVELEVALLRAVAARVAVDTSEIDLAAEIFDAMARSPEYLVRREAARSLTDLGVASPPVGPAETLRTHSAYREILQRTGRERFAELVTPRGAIRLRLACPEAPMTCLSFLQLASQGFYDGLEFHRVVPDFVVQAGDPSGGGWGGPGYALRDEINRIRYEAGVLGMAHSGPDTAGSQFFITLSPQPHLDGEYTAFGTVESGWEALRAIQQGDAILRLREVAP